ncbi:hypothetical protein PF007_g19429 [Phytophthora fragariae]|nr:hypothetical protein PF011_g19468 [Phytophthora fragariae]KAE9089926.1 hypothetical protein PF007_g19429 [Phytophthora fragariae]
MRVLSPATKGGKNGTVLRFVDKKILGVWSGQIRYHVRRTFKSEHFLAVFAIFGHDRKSESVLLAMTPLLDQEDPYENPHHSAEVHIDFLRSVLKDVKRFDNCVLFLVGDNCSVNGSMSAKMGVPFVGCAGYRLNLALARYLQEYATILDNIMALMKALRKLNNAAKHRQQTKTRHVLRQATRWSSTFGMVKMFFQLKKFVDITNAELAVLMPSPMEEMQVTAAMEGLKECESVSKKL